MRVIVTGATSFIGKAVTKELLAGGHHVFAVVRPDSPGRGRLEQPGAEAGEKTEEETGEETGNKAGKEAGKEGGRITVLPFALKDIGKLDACPELVSCPVLKSRSDLKTKADLWLHLGWEGAGSANRQDPHVQARNIGYALDSLHTAARLGCARFLFCGSQAEYGIADGVMGEEILCRPVSEYGKDKLEVCRRAGEEAKALGIDYIHARIFSVYGPGDHPWSLVSTCLNTFLKGGRMELGECTQQWNFLHVRDAARALTGLLLAKVPAGVYNVAGEDTRPLKSYIEQMHRLCGEKGTYEYGKRPPNAEGVVSLVPDIRKLKEAAGFAQEISFEDGIREMIGLYKENCL